MGDVARCSLGSPGEFHNENLLYRLFGDNAELLIDHAWGYESCTIADIKAYRPSTNSLTSGQVLHCPYTAKKARLIVQEMTDLLVLDLVEKGLVTDQVVLTIGYDIDNLLDPERSRAYKGPIVKDHYGRKIPKHAHGTANLGRHLSSTRKIMDAVISLYDRIVDENLLVRRINLSVNHVISERDAMPAEEVQFDLFAAQESTEEEALEREKRRQKAVLKIRRKFGKNAILKGMNFQEGATTRDRNAQIGGHKA
jgi:DNA polymerase V